MRYPLRIAVILAVGFAPASATPGVPGSQFVTRLSLDQPVTHDRFGEAVALRGDRILVGATNAIGPAQDGIAVLYRHSGTDWVEETRLQPSGPNLRFGRRVALGPDLAVVSGFEEPAFSPRVWVFERVGGAWTEVAKLTPPAPTGGEFGKALACSGNTLLVGAPGSQVYGFERAGRVYVYGRGAGGWAREAELIGDDVVNDAFGLSIALDGDLALVGAPAYRDFPYAPGALFVFARGAGGWTREQRLTRTPSTLTDRFGEAVALDGAHALVSGSGLYALRNQAGSWSQVAELPINFPEAVSAGGSVAASTDFGAPTVLVHARVGDAWYPQASLVPVDLTTGNNYDLSVANQGGRIVVGAPRDEDGGGAVYVYERPVGISVCTTVVNSTGSTAAIVAQGSPSLAANDLRLVAETVPDKPGLFFTGTAAVQVPFGPGYRCVGGSVQRLAPAVGTGGVLSLQLDLAQLGAVAGSTLHVQAWFRDSVGGVDSFSTTNAVSLTFAP